MTLFARTRAERAAAPEPARHPLGGSAGVVAGRGAIRFAERAATPEPARIPSGDRPTYPSAEGLQ